MITDRSFARHESAKHRLAARSASSVSVAALVIASGVASASDSPDLNAKIALPLLKLGGSTATAFYDMYKVSADQRVPGSDFQAIALRVDREIKAGRASSDLVRAQIDFVADSLAVGALLDPEPVTKVTAAVSSYGFRKLGESLGDAMYSASEEKAMSVFKRALDENAVDIDKLKAMKGAEVATYFETLKIDGKAITEIFKDQEGAKQLLKAHIADFHDNVGVAALLEIKATNETVGQIKDALVKNNTELREFRAETSRKLDSITDDLQDLKTRADVAATKMTALQQQMQGNTRSIQSLAQISAMGWTTAQKLAAMDSGLYPDLTPIQQKVAREALESQLQVERTVAKLQKTASDLDNIATIASNLGVKGDVVKAIKVGQAAFTAAAQFATGGYLAGIASISGIVGMGGGDASASRHAQIMAMLNRLDKKLDEVIKLQKQTLAALAAISDQLVVMHEQLRDVDRKVTLIHAGVLAQLKQEWRPCESMLGKLDNFPMVQTVGQLELMLSPEQVQEVNRCREQYISYFDARVRSPKFAGELLSDLQIPAGQMIEDAALAKQYERMATTHRNAFKATRAFVLKFLQDGSTKPARHLARLSEPMPSLPAANQLRDAVQLSAEKFDGFSCGSNGILNDSLKMLICQGSVGGVPATSAWSNVVHETPLSPYGAYLIDMGLPLGSLTNFHYHDPALARVEAVPFADIRSSIIAVDQGPTIPMSKAIQQRRGDAVLLRLRWLTDIWVLQQSTAYGDYPASLIVDVLFDEATNTLRASPIKEPGKESTGALQEMALEAIAANPVLARNVVLMAMLRSGGGNSETLYSLGVSFYAGAAACADDTNAKLYLSKAFPKWPFAYRASEVERKEKKELETCKSPLTTAPRNDSEIAEDVGTGLMVAFNGTKLDGKPIAFDVKAPTPQALATQGLEQPSSLRVALEYRAKVDGAIGAKYLYEAIDSSSESIRDQMALELLLSGCLSGTCK